MNAIKLYAAVLLIIAILLCVLFAVHVLGFELAAVLLLGDIAAYPTGVALLTTP